MIVDPGLLNHINHRLNDHESEEDIRQSLIAVGWKEDQVTAALSQVREARTNTTSTQKGNPEIFMLRNHKRKSALSGRLSVHQYFTGLLFVAIIDTIILLILHIGYQTLPHTPEINTIFFTGLLALILFNVFTLISISVRRLHDIGYANTWALFLFLPVINIVFLLFLCKPGMRGKNEYGEDPRFFGTFPLLLNR